jgi:hypothetical protein
MAIRTQDEQIAELLAHRDLDAIIGFVNDAHGICDCATGCPSCSRVTTLPAAPQRHPLEALRDRLRVARGDLIGIHGDDRYGDVEREVAGIEVDDADALIALLDRVIAKAA